MNENTPTETVPNELPNNSNMATELGHRTRLKMTRERTESSTEWQTGRQSRKQPRNDHRDLIAMDITAKDIKWRSNERIVGSSTAPSD
jgi:hypothetical protein